MGRWEPNAQGRLAKAALELYGERGFEQTTVEEIAKRAGLTERTFFRHFTDKREVLFWGAHLLEAQLRRALDQAPAALPEIDAVGNALQAVAAGFEERRDFARLRQRIIAANAELQERERVKLASLACALADGLRRRGAGEMTANLAAEMGIAIFRIAFERWIDETNERTFAQTLQDAFDALKAVVRSSRTDEHSLNSATNPGRLHAHFARDEQRRRSLATALRRSRPSAMPHAGIKSNGEAWSSESPRSVAEAIDLSDRIEHAMREWGELR